MPDNTYRSNLNHNSNKIKFYITTFSFTGIGITRLLRANRNYQFNLNRNPNFTPNDITFTLSVTFEFSMPL